MNEQLVKHNLDTQAAAMRNLGVLLCLNARISEDELKRVSDSETSVLARAVMDQMYEGDACPPDEGFGFKVTATGVSGHVEELRAWFMSTRFYILARTDFSE